MKHIGFLSYGAGVVTGIAVSLALTATPPLAEIKSTVVDELAEASYQERRQVLDAANQAARNKGLTLEALGKACNLLPVRIGALLSGQAPLELPTQDCLEKQIGLKAGMLNPLRVPPVRWNAGAIYRLHEAIDVYAPSLQRWMNERFGDAILSAIDFTVNVEETKGSQGERRMRIILDGKALTYSTDDNWRPTGTQSAGERR